MSTIETQNLRDCAILSIISIFGLSYFSVFAVHSIFFFTFPSTPGGIINALSVIFFSAGVITWYLSTLSWRVISVFQGSHAACWQKLELGGVLFLIWTTTLPAVILLFPTQPSLQLGYLAAFTVITVGNVVDFLVCDTSISVAEARFPYHCASLGLLSLVPAIHSLTENAHNTSALAIEFRHMALRNSLAAGFYLLHPLERTHVLCGWRPSLYVMHLVLAYSLVSYSRVVLNYALRSAA